MKKTGFIILLLALPVLNSMAADWNTLCVVKASCLSSEDNNGNIQTICRTFEHKKMSLDFCGKITDTMQCNNISSKVFWDTDPERLKRKAYDNGCFH
jgi:hypothetical protein